MGDFLRELIDQSAVTILREKEAVLTQEITKRQGEVKLNQLKGRLIKRVTDSSTEELWLLDGEPLITFYPVSSAPGESLGDMTTSFKWEAHS